MQTHELIDSGDACWVTVETIYSSRRNYPGYIRTEFDNQYFRLDKSSGKTEYITEGSYKDAKFSLQSRILTSKVDYLAEQYEKELEQRWKRKTSKID